MAADRVARGVGLTLGVLLGLGAVQGLAASPAQTSGRGDDLPAESAEPPAWLYDLPAEPAPPADPDEPAAPPPLRTLPETR